MHSYLCARLFSMGLMIRSGKRNMLLDCLQLIHTPSETEPLDRRDLQLSFPLGKINGHNLSALAPDVSSSLYSYYLRNVVLEEKQRRDNFPFRNVFLRLRTNTASFCFYLL